MHYAITGGAGHISKPLVQQLLAAGHTVTALGRSEANLAPLTSLGATAAIGSVEDEAFVTSAFAGADAVYLMIPPKGDAQDWYAWQQQIAQLYVNAVKANQIKKVVVLSSIGAHMRRGAGPIDGVAYLETLLDAETDIDAVYLRPSYFYYNLFSMIPLLKNAGILGSNFGGTDEKLVLVDTSDIADVAAATLLDLSFSGKRVQYISSSEHTTAEIAEVLSQAVGKPAPWVVFPDEQTEQAMLGMGLPATIAQGYTQMGKSLRQGLIQADYWQHTPARGKVTLAQFAQAWAAAYQRS